MSLRALGIPCRNQFFKSILFFLTDVHLRILKCKEFINGDMTLLLNNAIVWEMLSILQMEYSAKLLPFFAGETFKCLGDRDKN